MGSEGTAEKRPLCLRCSKPLRTCLCSRLPSPPLDNHVPITVLQHSLERRHPLNSIRLAKLAFTNLTVFPVSDVNFHAHLLIRPIYPDHQPPPEIPLTSFDFSDRDRPNVNLNPNPNGCEIRCGDDHISIRIDRGAKPDMRSVLGTQVGKDAIAHGFVVKKIQWKQMRGSDDEMEKFEEYEITVPPASALLYPSNGAIGLDAVIFEVKHLVVLDGTWGKARRMYCENPWLELMPHLKLELKTKSLYREVRHEPKVGCFSSVESIVCALKALGAGAGDGGGGVEKLDEILGVFESMVGDQRRCKNDELKRMEVLASSYSDSISQEPGILEQEVQD